MNGSQLGKSPDPAQIFIDQAPAHRIAVRSEICRQGSPVTHVFLLETGLVGLTFASPAGREFIVDFRSAGWILGAATAILDKRWPVSAITFQHSQVRALPAKTFVDALKKDTGALAWHALVMHSREIHRHIRRIAALGLLSTRQRVEEYLWGLPVNGQSSSHRVRLPLSQEELAQYILTTRQTLNKVLRDLEHNGLIRRSNGWHFLDRSRLWHREDPESQY